MRLAWYESDVTWTRQRLDEVWAALERPLKLLRARFRKGMDLAEVDAALADDIAGLFVFWGVLQLGEAWLMAMPERRQWLNEAHRILEDADRAATGPVMRGLASYNRGVTELFLGLVPEKGLSLAAEVGFYKGPIPHDADHDTFTEQLAAAVETLAPFDGGANALRTLAAAMLGLASTTAKASERNEWLAIAERNADPEMVKTCRAERQRLEQLSWLARRSRAATPVRNAILPISIDLDSTLLPERARTVLEAWSPAERCSDAPYRD
jgi:hypothetical protein